MVAPTGEEIAGALGIPWNPNDLIVTKTSLRFGANYLGSQLRRFDGDIFAAFAAYDAGPGSSRRWFTGQVFPGADGFFEAVDYQETRLYLEIVIENYGWCRSRYAGSPALAIRSRDDGAGQLSISTPCQNAIHPSMLLAAVEASG